MTEMVPTASVLQTKRQSYRMNMSPVFCVIAVFIVCFGCVGLARCEFTWSRSSVEVSQWLFLKHVQDKNAQDGEAEAGGK